MTPLENTPTVAASETRSAARQGLDHWGVRIAGTGSCLPGDPISNATLLERHPLDTSDEWIRSHVGIEARHWADADVATSDISADAARAALDAAGIEAEELARIIFCSTTPDYTSPAVAGLIQDKIGAHCPAEDKQVSCSSWMFGLEHGARLVATGLEPVLVVGADVKSRFVRRTDKRLLPVLADGAGAVVLSGHCGRDGLLEVELWSEGRSFSKMYTPAGGSAQPASHETVDADLHSIQMTVPGHEIMDHAVRTMCSLGSQVCDARGISPADLDLLVPHQANMAIMRKVAEKLGIAEDCVAVTIHETGNIVAATLPVAFDRAVREQRVGPGSMVLFVTAGAGYSGGAALYEMPGD